MFKNVLFRIVLFCWLLLAFTAHAAIDGLVSAANPSLQNVSSKVLSSDHGFRNDSYQAALAVRMIEAPTDARTSFANAAVKDRALPKSVWAFACGLAFWGVMRRRLSR